MLNVIMLYVVMLSVVASYNIIYCCISSVVPSLINERFKKLFVVIMKHFWLSILLKNIYFKKCINFSTNSANELRNGQTSANRTKPGSSFQPWTWLYAGNTNWRGTLSTGNLLLSFKSSKFKLVSIRGSSVLSEYSLLYMFYALIMQYINTSSLKVENLTQITFRFSPVRYGSMV